jgi:hypothetical protein
MPFAYVLLSFGVESCLAEFREDTLEECQLAGCGRFDLLGTLAPAT